MTTKILTESESVDKTIPMAAQTVFIDREERARAVAFIRELNKTYLFTLHQWTENDGKRIWHWIGLKIKAKGNDNDYVKGMLSGFLECADFVASHIK